MITAGLASTSSRVLVCGREGLAAWERRAFQQARMVRVIMEFVRLSRQGSLPPLVQGQPLPQRSPCFHDQFGILRREPDQVTARPPLAPVTVASNALVELTPLPELQESPAAFQLPHDPALSLLYVPGRYSGGVSIRTRWRKTNPGR